jgi:RNA polymerase sigma-70 factor (ECF subfamily)
MNILRNREDAEDEVQNALMNAFIRLSQYEGNGPFQAWLSRIVHNQCLMSVRSRRGCFVFLDMQPSSRWQRPPELPASEPDPEGDVAWRQMETTLAREIRHMPALLRNPLMLQQLNELPTPAIAESLGISISAAKSRLRRGRVELRSRLMRHCEKSGNVVPPSRTAMPYSKVVRRPTMMRAQAACG